MKRKRIYSTTSKHKKVSGKADLNKNNDVLPVKQRVYDMLVFSHLRWHFVYQRPQHIIEGLSKYYKILFIEEWVANDESGLPGYLTPINENVDVLRICGNETEIASRLKLFIAGNDIPIAWFYSAAFVPLLQHFNFGKVVYDCMDELTNFKGANPQLAAQEKYLLSEANVVFTGGKSLYESKKELHANVYCFPSSVDRMHFEQALNGIAIPHDLRLKHPVVGYYGVIDERIDLELLRETAEQMPEVSFVMVGPLAKISDEDLPRLANIHYTGMKPYAQLPAYLKAFDITMMPFLLNKATRFISPTKTLEFMAANKPIISTSVCDVVRDFGHCVKIIHSVNDFCNAIRNILHETGSTKAARSVKYDEILKATSWQHTVNEMYKLIK